MRPFLLFAVCLLELSGTAEAQPVFAPNVSDSFRGGRVEWARLNTGGPHWNRHAQRDENVLNFFRRNTSLNIDSRWSSVRPENMEELRTFPFIFCENLTPTNRSGMINLVEYLRRGGFILIDACVNSTVNSSRPRFLRDHVDLLTRYLPDLSVEVLPKDHEVFSIYFKMSEFPPTTRGNTGEPEFPLRAMYSGGRMIGMISLSGFQCGWAGFGRTGSPDGAMQMMTNIYVYAITR
jgi:hypothetical protein